MRALACTILVCSIVPLAGAQEPSVGGLTASDWARRLATEQWPKIEKTRNELAGFGEAALPVVRDLFRRPDGPRADAARILARVRPAEGLAGYLALLDEGPEYPRFLYKWIGELGPVAAPAVDRLAQALRAEDEETMEAAAKALGHIGTAAVPALLEALRAPDSDVRQEAARAIGWIEPPVRSAAPALAEVLDDPKLYTRGAAAFALLWIDPSTPGVARVLLEHDRDGTAWRIRARYDVRDHAAALAPDLVRVLFGPDAGLRDLATRQLFHAAVPAYLRRTLDRTPPDLSPFVAEARARLDAEEPEHAALAACLLARAAPETPGVVDALVGALRTGRSEIRTEAARALRILGPAARATVPDLIEAARGADKDLAGSAAAALPRVGAPPEEVVPLLLSGLRGELPGLRAESAGYALADFGEAGLDALPILTAALGRETTWTDQHRMNPRTVKGVEWPARVLGAFGPLAAPTVPALLESTTWDRHDTPPVMEWAAREAILGMGDAALPAVFDALGGEAGHAALAILRKLGPRARPAADRLRALLSEDGRGPCDVVVALARAEPEKPKSVRPLLEALRDRLRGKWEKLHALRSLGPMDAALLPMLRSLLDTEDLEERYEVARTIHRVGGDATPSVDALTACLEAGICPKTADEVLALAGERKGAIVARLLELFDEEEFSDVLRALGGAGAAGAPAIPVLEQARRSLGDYREEYDEELRLILRSIRGE